MRIEPPPSVPSASGPIPAATATAAPPDEPPQVWAWLRGFSVRPNSGPSVKGLWPALFSPRRKAGEAVRFAIDGRNLRAFGQEAARDRRADAMGGAGDGDRLAEKAPRVHAPFSQ